MIDGASPGKKLLEANYESRERLTTIWTDELGEKIALTRRTVYIFDD